MVNEMVNEFNLKGLLLIIMVENVFLNTFPKYFHAFTFYPGPGEGWGLSFWD